MTNVVPHVVHQTILEAAPDIVHQAVDDALSRLTATAPDTAVMVSIPETAKRLGLGLTTTKNLVTTGQIRSVNVDRRRLVPVDAIQEYVRDLEVQAARLRVPAKKSRPTGT
jgi:excisionase family DNA binding protein